MAGQFRRILRRRYRSAETPTLLRLIPEKGLDHVWSEHVIGQAAQAQMRPFALTDVSLVRPFLVYEILRDALAGQELHALRRLEDAFFGVPWEALPRAFAVGAAIGNSPALGDIVPGRIDVADEAAPGAFLGIEPRDLRVVFRKLSSPVTAFARARGELERARDDGLKYHPAVRRLDVRPVIEMDDYEGSDFSAAVPSPWHLRLGIESLVLDEFIRFADDNADSHSLGRDVYSARGDAFHRYLSRTLTETGNVVDLDKQLTPKAGQKIPDFLWLGQRFGIVIEAKVRMGPNSDLWGHDPMAIWESWMTGARALEQAASFLARDCDGLASTRARTWVAVIVTLQPLAAEASSFRVAAKAWRLLDNTGFSALAVVAPAELEAHSLSRSADDFAHGVLRSWDALDPWSPSRSSESVPFDRGLIPTYVREGWARLFPGLAGPALRHPE